MLKNKFIWLTVYSCLSPCFLLFQKFHLILRLMQSVVRLASPLTMSKLEPKLMGEQESKRYKIPTRAAKVSV